MKLKTKATTTRLPLRKVTRRDGTTFFTRRPKVTRTRRAATTRLAQAFEAPAIEPDLNTLLGPPVAPPESQIAVPAPPVVKAPKAPKTTVVMTSYDDLKVGDVVYITKTQFANVYGNGYAASWPLVATVSRIVPGPSRYTDGYATFDPLTPVAGISIVTLRSRTLYDLLAVETDSAIIANIRTTVQAAKLKNYTSYLGMHNVRQIGTDPELFAFDKDGSFIPAWLYAPKKASDNHQPFWDGAQVEFNTKPSSCLEVQTTNVRLGIQATAQALRSKFPDAQLRIGNVVDVPAIVLAKATKDQVALACDASLNAYPDSEGIHVDDPRNLLIRFAGGHLHFDTDLSVGVERIVKSLDRISGVIGVGLAATIDNPIRRQFYGMAGEYRVPGENRLEYRVLSNYWLSHPVLCHLTFDLARHAVYFAQQGLEELWKADEDEVRAAINNHDPILARTIIKRNEKFLRQMLGKEYSTNSAHIQTRMLQAMYEGLEAIIEQPYALLRNWGFNDNGGNSGSHGYHNGVMQAYHNRTSLTSKL